MQGWQTLSTPYAAPLHLILEPPRCWQRLALLAHGLALLSIGVCTFSLWIKVAASLVILGNLRLVWLKQGYVRGLTLASDGGWEIIHLQGTSSATLRPSTFVSPWMVILHLGTESRELAILLCRSELDPDTFRRLRCFLKINGMPDKT